MGARPSLHPALAAIRRDFEDAEAHLRRLRDRTPAERWSIRPDPDRWSMAECVAHLNLTSAAYRDVVEPALEEARRLRGPAPRYRRDPAGWIFWRLVGPPARLKFRTTAPFVPGGETPLDELVVEFARWQRVQIGWVEAAEGLPIDRVRVTSPFDPRVRYNLFACLGILSRHQHRHLWQAERVADGLG